MSTRQRRSILRPQWAVAALTAALSCSSVLAADRITRTDLQSRYQQERAACLSGQTNQSRADCLREAGAALADAKRGKLDDVGVNYEANQRARCAPLPADERKDCMARMTGQGTVTGSVQGGGIYRELVTIEPAPR